jgi:tripartite-type tricarboxylate transporter receptor subunit TctC
MPMIKGNKVKALAVTGSKRSGELPDVPSMAEAGFPGVNTALWSGFFAPVNVPAAITAKLEDALRKAIADPGVSDKLKAMAVSPGGGTTGAQFSAMIDKDIQGYVEVIKAAKLTFN